MRIIAVLIIQLLVTSIAIAQPKELIGCDGTTNLIASDNMIAMHTLHKDGSQTAVVMVNGHTVVAFFIGERAQSQTPVDLYETTCSVYGYEQKKGGPPLKVAVPSK